MGIVNEHTYPPMTFAHAELCHGDLVNRYQLCLVLLTLGLLAS